MVSTSLDKFGADCRFLTFSARSRGENGHRSQGDIVHTNYSVFQTARRIGENAITSSVYSCNNRTRRNTTKKGVSHPKQTQPRINPPTIPKHPRALPDASLQHQAS